MKHTDMRSIYFAASIRGGREDVELYTQLMNHIRQYGTILTEHIGKKELTIMGEDGISDQAIHDRDMSWLGQAQDLVAEVTTPSLGVGYELGRITERNLWVPPEERKRILCLHRPQPNKKLSAMIAGNTGATVQQYASLDEAKQYSNEFFTST